MDDATATDNCGEVSIEVSSETTAGDCAGNYTIISHVHCNGRLRQQQQRDSDDHGPRHDVT